MRLGRAVAEQFLDFKSERFVNTESLVLGNKVAQQVPQRAPGKNTLSGEAPGTISEPKCSQHDPPRTYFTVAFVQLLLYIIVYSHIFSHIIAYYRIFSYIIVYSRIFSYILVYNSIFSYIIIYYRILSQIIVYSRRFSHLLLYHRILSKYSK